MQTSEDLLHIPTPWHNCVVKIEGSPIHYVVKSKVAKEAIESGNYTGDWIQGSLDEGGYYSLTRSTVSQLEAETKALDLNEASDEAKPLDLSPKPMNFGFFIPPTFRATEVCELLEAVSFLSAKYKTTKVHLIGVNMQPVAPYNILPTHTIANCPELDVLVVPGTRSGDYLTPEIEKFLSHMTRATRYVFGTETGTKLLALAGALKGHKAVNKSQIPGCESIRWEEPSHREFIHDTGLFTSVTRNGTMNALYWLLSKTYPACDSLFVSDSIQ